MGNIETLVTPIPKGQTKNATTEKAIVISYSSNGHYRERIFSKESYTSGSSCYRNGAYYLDALLGGQPDWETVEAAGFDSTAGLKAYAIKDGVPLWHWVLTDGTVITSIQQFEYCKFSMAKIKTLDGRNVILNMSNVLYATTDEK